MSTPVPPATEYGVGGDYAGARRTRRAFRFSVAACVALVVSLWFSENYLRYDLNESQYRMSLLHEDASARPTLRNVVKRDGDQNAAPRARYLEALASVEEDDLVLSTYERAYTLSPNDPMLVLRYGCRLFLQGHYREARERFREAGIQSNANALPHYLEAAALAATAGAEGNLSEAISLIARANSTGYPVVFPEPFWHPSLPKSGGWYLEKKRHMVDLACAPLYRLRNILLARAATDINAGNFQDWDSWLERMQAMGARITGGVVGGEEAPGITQAIAGLQLQLDALELRLQIANSANPAGVAPIQAKAASLRDALGRLGAFEDARRTALEQRRELFTRPLVLVAESFLVLIALYVLMVVVARGVDRRGETWALAHPRLMYYLLGGGALLQLLLLLLLSMLQWGDPHWALFEYASFAWYLLLGAMVLLGLLYPAVWLPPVESVAERLELYEENEPLLASLMKLRRKALVTLLRRYVGALLGLFLCVICAWVVIYRVNTTLYPTQLKLLVPSMEGEEQRLVEATRAALL